MRLNNARIGMSKLKSLMLGLLLILTFNSTASASGGKEGDTFNAGEMALHHVVDSYEWHFHDYDFGVLHLPIIVYSESSGLKVFSSARFYNDKHERVAYEGLQLDDHGHLVSTNPNEKIYDISITKNVASAFLGLFVLIIIFTSVAKGYAKNKGKAPKGLQSFFEPLIIFVRDDIAKTMIGPKYEKFTPYLLSVFFFILFNNLIGLMPGAANLTGNIAVTLVLAIFTFLVTNLNGNKHYWQHILWMPGIPTFVKVILTPIEIIGMFTKPFSLMIRLFANITAGHIVILSIIAIIFIFKNIFVSPAAIAMGTAMTFLELMVAFIQAYVFTLLSAIYISGAVEESHDH